MKTADPSTPLRSGRDDISFDYQSLEFQPLSISLNFKPRRYSLADEDCAAVDVEDLAGDEAGEGGAEEEDGSSDLVDVGGTAERDQGQQLFGRFGVAKDTGRHFGGDPSGGDAVDVNSLPDEFAGEAFGEADESAFGGGVVGVEGFAALGCGGGDQDDVAAASRGCRLGFYLGYCSTDDAEDTVEVDAYGVAPLGGCHLGDGGVVGGPDAVIQDGAVEAAEGGDGSGDEGFAIFRGEERLLDSAAEVGAAALGCEGFSLASGGEVTEDDPGAGLAEEADGGCADSAGASGDEGDFSRQRHCDASVRAIQHILDAIESTRPDASFGNI